MAPSEPHDAPVMARLTEVSAMKFQSSEQTCKRNDTGSGRHASRHHVTLRWVGSVAIVIAAIAPFRAQAVDGCVVLLCLAAPSWRSIPECVPPIRQLFKDLLRGKAFPTCAMSGAGNGATHAWSAAPDFCPPQYTRLTSGFDHEVYSCDYDGAISVSVDGLPFARTWWSMGGDAVTDFSPRAKVQLGTWDKRFDDEFAAWLASQPSAAPQN